MQNYQTQSPIAFLIFRRPDCTRKVFEAIAAARPKTLLIVADGPRANRPGEKEECEATRAIVSNITWPCEVRYNFSEANLGCGKRVSTGLSWVFEQVDRAIILEDDCLPNPSFFRFCDELLEKYKDDERVGAIGGNNFQKGLRRSPQDYYFSRYVHIWGWATWRRTWQRNDPTLSQWPELKSKGALFDLLGNDPALVEYWSNCFSKTYEGIIDTWDYQLTLSTWLDNRLAICPSVNLVTNLGFGPDATHTVGESELSNMPTQELTFPLSHPQHVFRDSVADYITERNNYRVASSIVPVMLPAGTQGVEGTVSLAQSIHADAVRLLQANAVAEATLRSIQAIALMPNLQGVHLTLGCCLAKSGNLLESKSMIRKELELFPSNEQASQLLTLLGG